MTEHSMQERLIRLETLIKTVGDQYQGVLSKLDVIAEKLAHTAVSSNEILHLKDEQLAQWKKIDANKACLAEAVEKISREYKDAVDKINDRLDHHLSSCPGPERAREIAEEAKKLAVEAKTAATTATNLPGKHALAIIGGLLLLFSNVAGGFILYLLTR